MTELQLAVIDVKPGAALESQSGLQMLRPRIYGAYRAPAGPKKVAAIVMHPTSNFMGHYLIGAAGRARHLLHGPELALHGQRHGAADGARHPGPGRGRAVPARRGLREGGADRQLGRRGAGQLLPGAGREAHGAPFRRRRPDAPASGRPAAGRRHRAVRRAPGPLEADARLDRPFGHRRARPALGRPRARHVRRAPRRALQRRVPRALQRRAEGPRSTGSSTGRWSACASCAARPARRATRPSSSTARMPIRAASTCRIDRQRPRAGQRLGRCAAGELLGNAMGRTTSLTAFLSQWSSRSQADGPSNLARTTVPKLLLTYTADQSTFPSTRDAWLQAGGDAHPQCRHRRRQPLPGGPAASWCRRRPTRSPNGRMRCEQHDGKLPASPPPTSCRAGPSCRRPNWAAARVVRHPIVIVGAGPAGLTLACDLARRGVRAVLLDEDDTVGVRGASSRGICYAQKSLEIFERLGIYERIAAKGITWSFGRTFSGEQRGLQLQPEDRQRLGAAALHQPAAVLRRVVPGRSHPRTRPHRPALEEPRDAGDAAAPTACASRSRRRPAATRSRPST